ncbi:hypothetical protein [Cytobacillus firmus]|uniref:hypothetical protein n=1 Tax=Cytobacillus firmus TaxID=1399 RepID=UPI0018CCCE10|nr:hypothetical protein [Cytobacillus firmus]MBG9444866.1 hypothetical protein [Cytobacillus firmus]URT69776.1 hypothetical protein NAF01_18510 [Cytobacillus firmus]WHY60687.1 hypothetical protein QNH42_19180 [Cytobacillus firmus]
MKILYGVEAGYIIQDVPEFMNLIKNNTELFDFQQSIFLFEERTHAEFTKSVLVDAGLFEEFFKLYYIKSGVKGETFEDFAIETESGVCLFTELLSAFTITGGNMEDIRMAVYQFQEHLVFTAKEDTMPAVYFTEFHLKDLIIGIAEAYDIQVSFLDLDK